MEIRQQKTQLCADSARTIQRKTFQMKVFLFKKKYRESGPKIYLQGDK